MMNQTELQIMLLLVAHDSTTLSRTMEELPMEYHPIVHDLTNRLQGFAAAVLEDAAPGRNNDVHEQLSPEVEGYYLAYRAELG